MSKNLKMDLFDKIEADKDKITNKTKKVTLTDEEKRDIFEPEIFEDDNELVKTVKVLICKKQINLKELSHKFKNQMELNNYKRSLKIHRSMSWEHFQHWMEILDCECTINITELDTSDDE